MLRSKINDLQKKIFSMKRKSKDKQHALIPNIVKLIKITEKNENWQFSILCGIVFDDGIIGINFNNFRQLTSLCESEILQVLTNKGYSPKLPSDLLRFKDPNIYNNVNNKNWAFFTDHIYNNDTDDESFSRTSEILIPTNQ